jgi:hypothetical protein
MIEIPNYPGYLLTDDNEVINSKTGKLLSKSRQTNSYTYRCKVKNQEGKWESVALNRLILLARGYEVPKDVLPIPGYEGLFISIDGRCWSAPNIARAYGLWLELQMPSNAKKYPSYSTGGYGNLHVHQLLCITFLDKDYIIKGLVCMHLDDDKCNFKINNLKIGTYSENNKAAYETGVNPGRG